MISVKKRSALSGETNTMALPITEEEYRWFLRGELLVQEAFPDMDIGQREFLISGITPEEWEAAFGDEETIYPDEYPDEEKDESLNLDWLEDKDSSDV